MCDALLFNLLWNAHVFQMISSKMEGDDGDGDDDDANSTRQRS